MKTKEIILNADLQEISRLPQFVEEICNELQLPAAVSFNLNLVLEEAVTNIIQYAYQDKDGKTITVSAEYDPSGITLKLTDSGVAFDPTAVPDADTSLSLNERPVGGLGIFLIRQIMDSVLYSRESGHNILTLRKDISQS